MRAILTLIVVMAAIVVTSQFDGSWTSYPQRYQGARDIREAKSMQIVQTVCDQAHREISATSENDCAQAQAVTNSEYLCNSRAPGAVCWVEAR